MFNDLSDLEMAFRQHGAVQLLAKRLASNDNSKNQIYLSGGFAALDIIPHDEIYIDRTSKAGSKGPRPKARVEFSWLSDKGVEKAPNAQLILYPDYPEVRLSGLLLGTKTAPNKIIKSRDEGRFLFLGITSSGTIIGYAVSNDDPLALQYDHIDHKDDAIGVLQPWGRQANSKTQLLKRLAAIHRLGAIKSVKLDKEGNFLPYSARNAGGYTLEAYLGVSPNSIAGPDFAGWEIKQYSVKDFQSYRALSPVTLFTPEPDGGMYV